MCSCPQCEAVRREDILNDLRHGNERVIDYDPGALRVESEPDRIEPYE